MLQPTILNVNHINRHSLLSFEIKLLVITVAQLLFNLNEQFCKALGMNVVSNNRSSKALLDLYIK
jgi:hypothetical protein